MIYQLNAEEILTLWRDCGWASNDGNAIKFARAIEDKLAARCRAEGGVTCNNASSELATPAATAAHERSETPGDLPPLPERDGDWAGDDWYTADSMREYGRACIASNAGAAIPEGWKLVPVQMTDAMRDAGNVIALDRCKLSAIWRAMLDAAPSTSPVDTDQAS